MKIKGRMINVVVDIGNSRIKIGVFNETVLIEKFLLEDIYGLLSILSRPHDHLIVSSVKEEPDSVFKASSASKKIRLTSLTSLPVQVRYSTPHTLGVDRIAAICGAFQLFPNEDCLIIDMGTCINYELLDKNGVYWGGIISPGMSMRFEAMHTFTARLPLIQATMNPTLIGDSTEACMQSGVMNGILEEMKGIITRIKAKYPEVKVILCGGDAPTFENQLKPSIFAAPELVLQGLNRILIHNATT
jgi:type III pantothenate kinase